MTINQHIFNKNGLSYTNDNPQLLSLFIRESANINNCITEHNVANDNILLLLNTIATSSSELSDLISNTYNMLMDSVVLSNSGQSIFSLFDPVEAILSGVTIDRLTNTIYLNKQIKYKAQITDVQYSTNGDIGNSVIKQYVTRANIKSITSSNAVEFEKFDTSMQLSLNIKFSEVTPINGLKIKLSNISSVLPLITKILYVTRDNNLVELNYVGDVTSKIASSESEYGNIFIQAEQISAAGIIIQIEQNYPDIVNGKDRYTIGLSNLEIGYYESVDSGYAIFGPYNSSSPILKMAYSSDIVDTSGGSNASLSFSSNNKSWIALNNVSKITENKILNINNISNDAVFFDKPVKQFWLKLEVNAYDASSNVGKYRRPIIDNSQYGQNILLNENNTFTSIYEDDGFYYGSTSTNNIIPNTALFEFAKSDKGYYDLSEEAEEYTSFSRYAFPIVEQSNKASIYSRESILIETAKLLKMTTPTTIVVYLNGVNVFDLTRKYVIKVKDDMSHGLYELHLDDEIKYIDVSLGFVMSTMATLFKTTNTSATLIAPDGQTYIIEAITIADTKYISLIGSLFAYQDEKHNIYPHIPKPDSFYIERGGIVTKNTFDRVLIASMTISQSRTDVGSYANRHTLITDDIKKSIGETRMGKYIFKKMAKLKHCNIVEGTVRFDFSEAFINSMIKEVKFIDGEQEFVSSVKKTQFNNQNLNKITLEGKFIDDGHLSFYGGSNLFKNRVYADEDLVEIGDWLIVLEFGSYVIKLPEGVKTSASVDIAIEYNVDNNSINKDGIYSIDYINGVIYTSSPIDGHIIVKYNYFNMCIEGEAATEFTADQYMARDGVLTINKPVSKTLLIVYKEGKDEVAKFSDSPILTNISINTIAESYIKWVHRRSCQKQHWCW